MWKKALRWPYRNEINQLRFFILFLANCVAVLLAIVAGFILGSTAPLQLSLLLFLFLLLSTGFLVVLTIWFFLSARDCIQNSGYAYWDGKGKQHLEDMSASKK